MGISDKSVGLIQILNLCFTITIFLLFFSTSITKNLSFPIKEFYASDISCESDSMGLTINCGMKAILEDYKEQDNLLLGRIYIYQRNATNPADAVIHRLVGCADSDCSTAIFKGDNNLVAELVNKSQIRYLVTRLQYE